MTVGGESTSPPDSDATLAAESRTPAGRTPADPSGAGEAGLPALGSRIGRFKVIHLLGRGGMGAVFLAEDPQLGRQVAIKLVATGEPASLDSVAAARLTREAQAMAKVTHPNLVHVYDVGVVEGRVWIAMEYVRGRTLRKWLEEHPQREWTEVLELFVAAGRGVAAAHRAKLVHRDFKPDNVIVGDDGIVRVLDFGLARDVGVAVGSAAHATAPTVSEDLSLAATVAPPSGTGAGDLALTRTGALVGTPAYMSPEQFRGEPTDARTDIYSFCVSLYEALFVRRPFEAGSYPELVQRVTGDAPIEVPAGRVPAWLAAALLRGLARERAERWASMDELLAELAGDPARVATAAGGRGVRFGAIAFGMLLLAGGVAYAFAGGDEPARTVAEPAAAPAPTVPPGPDDAAARQALAMVLIAPNGAERLNRAEQYLDEHGERGGLGRLALAEAVAARELWSMSCPTARMSLCVAERSLPVPTGKPGCLTPGLPPFEVVARDGELSTRARGLAADAVAHARAGGLPDPGDAIVEQAWATLLPEAEAIAVDSALEAYLAIAPDAALAQHGPSKLGPAKQAAMAGFTTFLARKREALDALLVDYDRLIAESTGFAKVVGLSRRALARQSLFDAVARIPIPRDLVGEEYETGYCDLLAESVRPFADAAVADFRGCVEEAMRARLSSEYVSFCEEQIEGIERLDRQRMREVVRSQHDEVRACYEAGLVKDPSLTGTILMRFTIGPSGAVTDSMLDGKVAFPDAEVATCVERVVRSLTFPAPADGGSVTVTYPFTFESESPLTRVHR